MNRSYGIAVAVVVHVANFVSAGEPYQAATTIVPFAVPVAVPVAVVAQPTVLYGWSRYASPGMPEVAVSDAVPANMPLGDDALRPRAEAVLKRRCAECHTGPEAQGSLTLFDATTALLTKLPRHRIAAAVRGDGVDDVPQMPPGGRERPTVDEIDLLRRWARLPKSFAY